MKRRSYNVILIIIYEIKLITLCIHVSLMQTLLVWALLWYIQIMYQSNTNIGYPHFMSHCVYLSDE